MSTILFRYLLYFLLIFSVSCANRGLGPQGGPKDKLPPLFIESSPSNGAINIKTLELVLEFNEFIALQKPQEKIIISPPQLLPPTIRTASKKILVTLNDSLRPNTTYSIDFTDAIVDITEQNALSGFTYSFSTGPQIDSLQISGFVLDAANLNPLPNLLIGIYDNLSDTAFTKTPPLRIGRTNETGRFSIKSVKEGKYFVFALNDLNRDYYYNDPNEQLAFLDSLIVPSVITKEATDTVATDSTTIKKSKQVFLPDSLILLAFKEKISRQFFIKAERKLPYKLSFIFKADNKKLPEIEALNFTKNSLDFIQSSALGDTISYWVSDSLTWKKDTLQLAISYQKTDSAGNPALQKDTLLLTYKNAKPTKKEKQTNFLLPIRTNLKGLIDLNSPVIFNFDLPILSVDETKIHLTYKKDTIWEEIPINLEKMDSLGFIYGFNYAWDAEKAYRLSIDSAAFTSKYLTTSSKVITPFAVKSLDQYATVIVNISPFNPMAVVELLNNKDQVIRQLPAEETGTVFEFIPPGLHYIRLFIDENNNGQWDSGVYAEKRQAEKVFYYEQGLNLRANWDIEQAWNYLKTPLLNQKPKELLNIGKK